MKQSETGNDFQTGIHPDLPGTETLKPRYVGLNLIVKKLSLAMLFSVLLDLKPMVINSLTMQLKMVHLVYLLNMSLKKM